ncbi:RNA ligase 1 [Gadus macrocephalus]|uniref:RNA ligase 1 n=1 Tax=Gadus macrocephalus TaxID=80720 RepID=UPI0028CB84F4|nr:RNA ligase 1 [Gadus macrocephalus]
MSRLSSVQQKVPCLFLTEVKQEQSRKRLGQPFQVIATEHLNPLALESNVESALATEKLDGTCCYVTYYEGQPYLWARLDRKPTKLADKSFKKYQHSHKSSKGFTWKVEEDFRTVPEAWIPAHGVKHHEGTPVPDDHGHIPGWVPVQTDNKQYCWHSSTVDYDAGVALVLRPGDQSPDLLELALVPLVDLMEQTLELIGTNVNGNPYGMGAKKQPLHALVSHGSVGVGGPSSPPPLDLQGLTSWFQESREGGVEGIVWHCDDGTLVKVHRHHLGLGWPDGDCSFSSRPVEVRVDWTADHDYRLHTKDLFASLSRLDGQRFSRLQDVRFDT